MWIPNSDEREDIILSIPESQLGRWSDHGSQDAAKRTHEEIRRILAAHTWPPGVRYDFYLQGSYQNDTNIGGGSDVDAVLELKSTVHYDTESLTARDRQRLESTFSPPAYGWNHFRREALKVLEQRLGSRFVGQGNKTIKVKAHRQRLAADVVICSTLRRHTSYSEYVEGITLYALQDKRWIVNYPKLHYENNTAKGRRTFDRYKRTVRMFKNARNCLESDGRIRRGLAPSYFVECLLYNAPDDTFKSGFQDTYCSIVNWMVSANLENLVCQHGQQRLFGTRPEQWSVSDAKTFSNGLADLWNKWD